MAKRKRNAEKDLLRLRLGVRLLVRLVAPLVPSSVASWVQERLRRLKTKLRKRPRLLALVRSVVASQLPQEPSETENSQEPKA